MRPATTDTRRTQRDRLLGLLLAARGAEVSLREIMALGIAQHGARLSELKELGFTIVNRQEIRDGKRWSWYRLQPSGPSVPPAPAAPAEHTDSLFGDLAPDRSYRE